MSIHGAMNMSILVGGFEAAANSKSLAVDAQCNVLDSTPLSTTDLFQTVQAGQKSWSFQLDGMQDFAVNAVDTIIGLSGYFATPQPFTGCPDGIVDGSIGYFGYPLLSGYTPMGERTTELGTFQLKGKGAANPLVRGMIIHPTATARIASGTGTQQSIGALSATQKMWAALHVVTASGSTPSLTVKVQSATTADSGFASPTDRITFTAASDITNPQVSSVTGAITDTRWRVAWTISGSSPSFNFAVCAGIASFP